MADTLQTVQVGQVWKDNDKRIPVERYLQVVRLGIGPWAGYAYCVRVMQTSTGWTPIAPATTQINLKRFKPNATGYVLVDDGK